MLGCTHWNPTPGREICAHNGMEQQARRCWFHSGRTQMAEKHSSACRTWLCSTELKSSWFSFISVCCWKEIESWKLHNISHQTKLTIRRVRRQLESLTCHHFRVAAKSKEDKVLSKASSISPARHSWDDRNSRVRHKNELSQKALQSSFLKQTRWFLFLCCFIYTVTTNVYSRSHISAPCGFDLYFTVWVLLGRQLCFWYQLLYFDWRYWACCNRLDMIIF